MTYTLEMADSNGKCVFCVCGMTADMVRGNLKNVKTKRPNVKFYHVINEFSERIVTDEFPLTH